MFLSALFMLRCPRPGLEIAGCQWRKAGNILEMAGKNKFELPE
jgi:hypothetical protein